ncbi:MAG: hypothetical protein ACXVYY_00930 [Oryzihumus sp.]
MDLSLTQTGVALDGVTHTVRSKPVKAGTPDTVRQTLERLQNLTTGVLVHVAGVDVVCVEGPSLGSKGGHTHDRSGLWWMVYDRLSRLGIAVAVIPPNNVKKYATGRGNADKDAVLADAIRRLGFPGKSNDEADAWVMRCMGLDHYGLVTPAVPASHRVALDKIEWP